jgi:hypothetical protein
MLAAKSASSRKRCSSLGTRFWIVSISLPPQACCSYGLTLHSLRAHGEEQIADMQRRGAHATNGLQSGMNGSQKPRSARLFSRQSRVSFDAPFRRS